MSPTVIRGFSEVYGSCRTIWISRRSRRNSPPRNPKMSRPSNFAAPAVGSSSRISTWAKVDFPQPDSPTTPRVSPGMRSNETPSTAFTCPMVRLNRTPVRTGKCFTRFCTERIGSTTAAHHLFGEVTRADPAETEMVRGRDVGRAASLGTLAPRVERTARRDVQQAGRQALDRFQLLSFEVQPGQGVHQRGGVGVPRRAEQLGDVRLLDDPARVHH